MSPTKVGSSEEPVIRLPFLPPTTVTEALANVMAEVGGIEKMTPEERRRRGLAAPASGERGITYAYRGIDQIAALVQPLLAKNGVVITPRLTSYEIRDITVNNNPWTDTIVTVAWTISGPGDTTLDGASIGQGRDNSDKGPNKAMTSAFKNLVLKLLCIGDPSDDTDGHNQEADGSGGDTESGKTSVLEQEVAVRVSKLNGADKSAVTKLAKEAGITNVMRSGAAAKALNEIIDKHLGVEPTTAPDETPGTETT